MIIDAGSGTDGVVLDVQHMSLNEILISIEILGVGLVSVDTLFPNGILELAQKLREGRTAGPTEVALTQVGSDLTVDVRTGASDDLIKLDIDPAADGSVRFSADTGGGDDNVNVTGSSGFDLFADIDLGDDDDVVEFQAPTFPRLDAVRATTSCGCSAAESRSI